MAVGDIERMVEGLVNRGLVSPKMVGRTVGQATIDELKNLGTNIQQSQAIRQATQANRLSQFTASNIKNLNSVIADIERKNLASAYKRSSSGRGISGEQTKSNLVKDINAPFILGKTKGNMVEPERTLVAIKSDKGYKIGHVGSQGAGLSGEGTINTPLLDIAKRNTLNPNIPMIKGTSLLSAGKEYSSLNSLINALAVGLKDQISPADLSRYYNL